MEQSYRQVLGDKDIIYSSARGSEGKDLDAEEFDWKLAASERDSLADARLVWDQQQQQKQPRRWK